MKATASKENSTPTQSSNPFFSKKGGGGFWGQTKEVEQPFFLPRQQPVIQAKLTINEPGDQYEQEADAMADRVMRMSAPLGEGGNEGVLQVKQLNINTIQDKCAACEEEEKVQRQEMEEDKSLQTKPLMRKSAEGGGYTASPLLASQLDSSKGGGDPLPRQTLASMNQAFGADFSKVRVHTGSQAAEMSQGIQAKAFTHGTDIYFNRGQYSPESLEGRRLLGHELVHVVQQNPKPGYFIQKKQLSYNEINKELHNLNIQEREIENLILHEHPDCKGRKLSECQRRLQKIRSKIVELKTIANQPTPQRNAIKTKALSNLTILERSYEINYIKWEIVARNVGSAYASAADLHARSLGERDKVIAQRQAIMFGVLTAATAGGLSWLSSVAQATTPTTVGVILSRPGLAVPGTGWPSGSLARDIFVNSLEDAAQAGASEAIDIWQLSVANPSVPVSQNPLTYQNEILNYLAELHLNVKAYIQEVHREFEDLPMAAWDNFDPEKQAKIYKEKLEASKLAQPPSLPDVATMQNQLERGMWAKWLPSLKRTRSIGMSPGSFEFNYSAEAEETYYDDLTEPVEDRLDYLGISAESGVGKFRGTWTWSDEVKKAVDWAYSYRQPQFF